MNSKALKILEFNRITEALTASAESEPAKHMCEGLRPSSKRDWILKSLDETEAATERILKSGSISFGSNRDFGSALKSLSVGQSLTIPELLHIASFLENVARVRDYGMNSAPSSQGSVSGSGDEGADATLKELFL